MRRLLSLKERAVVAGILGLLLVVALFATTMSSALAQAPSPTAVATPAATPTPTPVPSETGTISPSGGSVSFAKGAVVLKALDASVAKSLEVRFDPYTAANAPAPAPTGWIFGSQIFTLGVYDAGKLQDNYRFARLVEMTVKYTAADKASTLNKRDDQVRLYVWDGASKVWVRASAVQDVVGLALISNTDSVGTYALLLQAPPTTPTPVVTAAPKPTVAPTAAPKVAPTATIGPPRAGDVAPGTGMVAVFLLGGLALVFGGGFLLLQSTRKSKA